ncbi:MULTISPECIES: DNA methyltransferase [Acidithiobacillus]|uniref:site-specific DNA-methyltransferase (adenine-specific) n=2 Tax=Acidithiobacillus TaxID=119977 RepID=A0A179BMM6_ACIFR|nr:MULTISPECIES: DNA methyltransferase [Acidithiobacillus]MEB8488000.1 DNA methyltransferase [Acidithiobacillus ferriphilus]MEB8489405.1 DNA methyltransferase [Acidithiobacillus ferriphilus]MEB8493628.1 DNA methyltransferase [Acidithiobacillus ferriphilus]MEB8515395.1 DNA methyltransferase [Acidithiobacillus ferriphilus]MEB8520480.1 DNA methyltransferase [Acidithiobacillus ferriphilus]
MAKQDKKAYDLSEAEQRDLVTLLQQGKALPEKYRFILFEDKREVELVWNGKTRDVCMTVLPFQTLEHIDEPRAETKTQGDLFDSRGRQQKGWANKLIWGDNKLILSSLKSGALRRQIEDAGGLKLIYIDPPFDVGADFSMDIEIGGETFHKEPNLLEQIAYRDTWGRGADSFISMIYERLILMRDLLAVDGSIYVHCDWRVNSFIRQVLDEVFGKSCYRNEIRWKRQPPRGAKAIARQYAKSSDTILYYSRGDQYCWNPQFKEYNREYIKSKFVHRDRDGRIYRIDAIGDYSDKSIAEFRERGRIYDYPSGKVGLIRYLDEAKGEAITDIWIDVAEVNSQAIEGTGYATQKPERLLERIINASSNPGDLIADFFCGSGTTAAIAEKLGRKWIATDLGKFGIHTTRKRLIGVQRVLKAASKDFRAFEVLNLGRYERQAYLNVGGRLTSAQKAQALAQKENEFRELILRAYKATGFGGSEGLPAQDGFFHGARNGRLVVIGPINLPVGRLFVEEVITECRKRGASRVDVLAFEFEMGLFPAVLEEARSKGIDLAPKYIPAEVFDKRAVDKGQVVFHDISFVEATPRYEKKNKLAVRIELTDFSVYYTQGTAEAAIAAMKEGKSEVMCEQGQLYKVSKNKDGIITKERLTKQWTDWVDYWAVDFDYMSRREIIKVPVGTGHNGVASLPGLEAQQGEMALPQFEERWTGGYIFENEWQSFRTRQNRDLELTTALHTYDRPGRYTVAVKVIDIFGNDTMTLVPMNVG